MAWTRRFLIWRGYGVCSSFSFSLPPLLPSPISSFSCLNFSHSSPSPPFDEPLKNLQSRKKSEDYYHHHHHHNHQSIGVSITLTSCNLPFPSRYSNLVAVVVLGGSCLNSIPSLDLEEFGSESTPDFSLKEVAASGSDESRVGIAGGTEGTGGGAVVVV